MKKSYICFVAGKSGGHLIPCITQAQKIIKEHPELSILFFTTRGALDKKIISNYPFISKVIDLPLTPFPYYRFWLYPKFAWNFARSFFHALFFLYRYAPVKIISMGGVISLPVCIAGKGLSIPFTLYELNVVPGATTKELAPLATELNVCFAKTKEYFAPFISNLISYPLRFDEQTKKITKHEACARLHLDQNKKTLLMLGGSQGSVVLNSLMKTVITTHADLQIQIIHQAGNHDTTELQEMYEKANIPFLLAPFFNDIEWYYAAADLVICRAGAGSLFETLFFEKPCIVIPLETESNNHQLYNALACAEEHPQLISVSATRVTT